MSARRVNKVNVSLTDQELAKFTGFMSESGASRSDVIRAGLVALSRLTPAQRLSLLTEIRQTSPKAGRPPINNNDKERE